MSDQQDSTADTLDHIGKVGAGIAQVCGELATRAAQHDASKLLPPEKAVYDRVRPLLDATEYGSDDYRAATAQLGDAFVHHCEVNRHHPEHFGDEGVDGMNLVDVIEMVCDWRAASQRRPGVDVRDGLAHNFEKYGIGEQLAAVIVHTVDALWPSEVTQ